MISFSCISPHPPIILPSVGSKKDRDKVVETIDSLTLLGKKLVGVGPQEIIISSPHSDWGFNVPLFFLAKNFKGEVKTHLIGQESPEFYLEEGKKLYQKLEKNKKYALIASGDMSHCLREDGPYGFQPDGPKFDKELIDSLAKMKMKANLKGKTSSPKKKNIENILKLDNKYPEAGECGLRSFCFILGILEASGVRYQPEILSYEGPFGVGYLVVDFKL